MFQYLENKKEKTPEYWQIGLNNLTLNVEYGEIGSAGSIVEEQVCEDEFQAFSIFKTEIIKKMNAGYSDPEGNVSEVDFLDETYDNFLDQKDFENAEAWLVKFGEMLDGSYEDRLVKSYIEDKKYKEAEFYIFGRIKVVKKVEVIARQLRYLSFVNPMMCRFMIGNLPAKPVGTNMELYYKDLAIAQSAIGMLSAFKATLRNIDSDLIKVIYLANLLDETQQKTEDQVAVLEDAIRILEGLPDTAESRMSMYLLLSKKALAIGQQESSERLQAIAESMSEKE